MKVKSVLAAIVAVAALSATTVLASAEVNVPVMGVPEIDGDAAAAPEDDAVTTDDGDAAPVESDKDNPDSGVEGVAAVVGAITLAGAAVVISRKRA